MANRTPGIKRCLLAPSGRMSLELPWAANTGTPATTWAGGLVTVGSRKPSRILINGLDVIPDYRNRELRNKMNLDYSVDSFQLRMRDLEWMMHFVKNGFDIQMVGERQNSGAPASGGIFNFLQQKNGLGFEYVMTNKERYMNVKFATAMEYDAFTTWLAAADDAVALEPVIAGDALSGGNERGENFSNYKYPWYLSIEAPDATEIFNKKEIVERSFKLMTKGIKNEYNEDVVHWISVELILKSSDATIDKMANLLAKDMSPSLTIKEALTATTYEKFAFQANVLTHKEEFDIGDENATSQIIFTGDIALDQLDFGYGAANGGVGTTEEVEPVEGTTEAQARQGGTFTFGDA